MQEVIFFIFFEITTGVNFSVDLFHFSFGEFDGFFGYLFKLIGFEIFIKVVSGGGSGFLAALPSVNFGYEEFINKGLKVFGSGISLKAEEILVFELLDFGADGILFEGVFDLFEVAEEVDVLIKTIDLVAIVVGEYAFSLIELVDSQPELFILPFEGFFQEVIHLPLFVFQ